jgi:hypothetical protein
MARQATARIRRTPHGATEKSAETGPPGETELSFAKSCVSECILSFVSQEAFTSHRSYGRLL